MSEVKERDKRVRGADNNCDYISFESAPHSHFICEYKKKTCGNFSDKGRCHFVVLLSSRVYSPALLNPIMTFSWPPRSNCVFFLTAPQRGARQDRVISEIHILHDVHDTKYGLPPSTSDPWWRSGDGRTRKSSGMCSLIRCDSNEKGDTSSDPPLHIKSAVPAP